MIAKDLVPDLKNLNDFSLHKDYRPSSQIPYILSISETIMMYCYRIDIHMAARIHYWYRREL